MFLAPDGLWGDRIWFEPRLERTRDKATVLEVVEKHILISIGSKEMRLVRKFICNGYLGVKAGEAVFGTIVERHHIAEVVSAVADIVNLHIVELRTQRWICDASVQVPRISAGSG